MILVGGVEAVSLAIHVTGVAIGQAGMSLVAGRLARAVSCWVASLSPGCWPGDTACDDAGQWRRGPDGVSGADEARTGSMGRA